LHDAGVGGDAGSEREVTGAVECSPVVDPVKGREVAFDVELIVEYPVNLCPPFFELD